MRERLEKIIHTYTVAEAVFTLLAVVVAVLVFLGIAIHLAWK